LVSAGFDCDHRDPLGAMSVTPAGFTAMARACTALARETAGGRIAAVLEGGYDPAALVEGVDAVLGAMRGTTDAPAPPPGHERLLHELGPDGSGGVAAGLVGPERALGVEADPDPGEQVRREADEPGVVGVVGGAGLPGDRPAELRGLAAGPVLHDGLQHARHD